MKTTKSTDEEFRVAFDYLRTVNKTELQPVAEACGCSKRHIQGILSEKERKGASRACADGISKFFKLNYEDFIDLGRWIISGRNPEGWPRPFHFLNPDFSRISLPDPPDFIPVRKASIKLTDDGYLVYKGGVEDIYHFKAKWLSNLCLQPNIAVLFEVDGASMEPTLKDKDSVLVDTSDDLDFHSDSIYAIKLSKTVTFKRLRRMISGEVEVIADNPDKARYPNEVVVDLKSIMVIGEVVWRGGAI